MFILTFGKLAVRRKKIQKCVATHTLLSVSVEDFEVHGVGQVTEQDASLSACHLVGYVNALCLPVWPVHGVGKDRQSKRVLEVQANHSLFGVEKKISTVWTNKTTSKNETLPEKWS